MATAGPSREVILCEYSSPCLLTMSAVQELQASTVGVVVDNFRRTWDKEKYEKIAKDRTKKDGNKFFLVMDCGGRYYSIGADKPSENVKREMLKARDYKVSSIVFIKLLDSLIVVYRFYYCLSSDAV